MRLTRWQRRLLGLQVLALVAVLAWAAWSLWQTERELAAFGLPEVCPNDGQELLMVPIVYGAQPAEVAAPEAAYAYLAEPAREEAPAFLLRCPQCSYQAPGYSIAQMRLLEPAWLARQAAAITADRAAVAAPAETEFALMPDLAAATDSGVDYGVTAPKVPEQGGPRQ